MAYEIYVMELGIMTPYDLRTYADSDAAGLTMGVRSLLRWLADRWEDATPETDWDEVKPLHSDDTDD